MSHPGEEVVMERIKEDIAEMSREERVEFIIERDLQPSDWYWNPHAWSEGYMAYLILMHKWEGR